MEELDSVSERSLAGMSKLGVGIIEEGENISRDIMEEIQRIQMYIQNLLESQSQDKAIVDVVGETLSFYNIKAWVNVIYEEEQLGQIEGKSIYIGSGFFEIEGEYIYDAVKKYLYIKDGDNLFEEETRGKMAQKLKPLNSNISTQEMLWMNINGKKKILEQELLYGAYGLYRTQTNATENERYILPRDENEEEIGWEEKSHEQDRRNFYKQIKQIPEGRKTILKVLDVHSKQNERELISLHGGGYIMLRQKYVYVNKRGRDVCIELETGVEMDMVNGEVDGESGEY